jgi:hypothetical protein
MSINFKRRVSHVLISIKFIQNQYRKQNRPAYRALFFSPLQYLYVNITFSFVHAYSYVSSNFHITEIPKQKVRLLFSGPTEILKNLKIASCESSFSITISNVRNECTRLYIVGGNIGTGISRETSHWNENNARFLFAPCFQLFARYGRREV